MATGTSKRTSNRKRKQGCSPSTPCRFLHVTRSTFGSRRISETSPERQRRGRRRGEGAQEGERRTDEQTRPDRVDGGIELITRGAVQANRSRRVHHTPQLPAASLPFSLQPSPLSIPTAFHGNNETGVAASPARLQGRKRGAANDIRTIREEQSTHPPCCGVCYETCHICTISLSGAGWTGRWGQTASQPQRNQLFMHGHKRVLSFPS